MSFSVSEAKVAATQLSSAKKEEVIDLLDSDDDEQVTVLVNRSSARRPLDKTLIDLASPLKRTKRLHQPEIVDLLDTKPAARRKNPDGDINRLVSPQRQQRQTSPSISIVSNDVEIIENYDVGKPKAVPIATLPGFFMVRSTTKDISPLMKVLEVFPDVAVDHAKKLLIENKGNAEAVVATILSNENYPKEQSSAARDTSGTATAGLPLLRHTPTVVVERLRTQPKYDYSSPNSFQPMAGYVEQACQQLVHDFPFLRIPTIRSILQNNHSKYTLARRHIHDTIVGKVERLLVLPTRDQLQHSKNEGSTAAQKPVDEKEENQHFQVLNATLIRGKISDVMMQRMGEKFCVRRPRNTIGTARPTISDEILRDEVHHFELELHEWTDKIQKRLRRAAARKMSLENGSSVLCECCYEDVAVSECVPCRDNGHLFCSECVQQYVETQVFGAGSLGIDRRTKKPATEILCCSGDCTSGFQDILLEKVLPTKTWERYCELQHIAVAERAGLGEEMSFCSKCGFRAYVPETQMLFECPVKDCMFVSCKKCGKEPHIPLRCDEVVQKQRQDEGRLKIEEALSEAKMRTCPRCKQKFIKESGCNKMVCRCGLKLCYICRSPLDNEKPYSHFCQTPLCNHENCGKCNLYSNAEADDLQAMREAGISAAERYKAEIQKEDGTSGVASKVDFDIEQMIQVPAKR